MVHVNRLEDQASDIELHQLNNENSTMQRNTSVFKIRSQNQTAHTLAKQIFTLTSVVTDSNHSISFMLK